MSLLSLKTEEHQVIIITNSKKISLVSTFSFYSLVFFIDLSRLCVISLPKTVFIGQHHYPSDCCVSCLSVLVYVLLTLKFRRKLAVFP